jgi:hypothetical protein
MAEVRDIRQAFVNAVMKLRVPEYVENFLNSWLTINLSYIFCSMELVN